MEITRGYKTELDLNKKQRTLCLQHAGCARYAYNWGLARKQAAYAARKAAADPKTVKIPTAMDLHKELNALKKTEFPWMYQSSKCAPQDTDLETNDRKTLKKRHKKKRDRKSQGACALGGLREAGTKRQLGLS